MKLRPEFDDNCLDMCMVGAKRGTCLRRNYFSMIVDEHGTIVSTGYNGAPRKVKDCTEIGECWRDNHNIPSGTMYEKCESTHSEDNAIIQAGKAARGSAIYIAGYDVKTREIADAKPCFMCAKRIINAEIVKIIIRTKDGGKKSYDPYELYKLRRQEAMDV